jgi:benzoate-CoA ligase family protein
VNEVTDIYERLPERFNASEYFIRTLNTEAGRANHPALFYKEEMYTYGEMERQINKYGNAILNKGIQMKERIAILVPDHPAYVFAFWGVIRTAIVPVLINTRLHIEDIRYILQDSQARLLITTRAWKQALGPLTSTEITGVLLIDEDAEPEESLQEWTAHSSDNLAAAPTSRDDIAFWLYTSGSSGRPKGVLHLHHDMVICTELYGQGILKITEDDLLYSVAKLPFAYGLGNTTFLAFGAGAASVVSDAQNAMEIIEVIQRFRPTLFFAVPSAYQSVLHMSDIVALDTSPIRICVSAGEVLPRALWHQWQEKFGDEIVEGLGTTELLHIFISNRPGSVNAGSTGKAVPGYSVSVVDEYNNPVPPGTIGELMVCGESLMQGYWNRQEENERLMQGSCMKTGDKFYQDDDGYFWYAGRSIDLFKVNGLWVRAQEVENILLLHPKIKEASVNGEISQEQLTKVAAYLVLQPDAVPSEALSKDIIRFMKSRMEHYKCPSQFYYIPEIPKGPTGKIDRVRLRDLISISR